MIQEIQITDSRWDTMIRSLKGYDIFYLSNYVKAFQQTGEGIPILIWGELGKTRAINVVMKRDIAEDKGFKGELEVGKYYDLRSPYGYGGFLFEGDQDEFKIILNEYEKYCQGAGYICEFVRFELAEPYRELYTGKVETRTHNVIRNLQLPLVDIVMDFEHKVRKNLKKADKSGLKIIIDYKGEYLNDFLRIYYGTMERTNAEEDFFFSKEFFETLNQMSENVVYFHVLYEEKIISSELVVYGSKNAYSYLGGTDQEYFSVRPNDYIKFEIIKWAKEKGLENFVLGGGYGSDDGIFRYKKSLAPNGIVEFYIGKKVFNESLYAGLVERRMKNDGIRDRKYFPLYRG